MPITRYLGAEAFDPATTSKMSRAFLRAVETLGVDHNESRREMVAHFIVQMAKWNSLLDEDAFYSKTIAALGGPSSRP